MSGASGQRSTPTICADTPICPSSGISILLRFKGINYLVTTTFLVSNLQLHAGEYHQKARKVKRCEAILEEAISELIVAARFDAQWRQVDANFGAFRLARRGSFSFR
jgi:hypothetical protein